MDEPSVDKELLASASTGIIADALLETVKLMTKSGIESSDVLRMSATFMVLIQQVCMKACVFISMGDKDFALKSADLLHAQVVRSLEKATREDDDETTIR